MYLYLSSIFALVSCITLSHSEANGKIYNAQLREAYDSYASTMSVKRNPIYFESGESADNCLDYLRIYKKSTLKEDVNNRIISQEYIICESLNLIKGAARTIEINYQPKSYGNELATRMDLRSFRSSLFRKTDEINFTPNSLGGVFLEIDEYSITFNSDVWFFKFEIVANYDFNNDGKDDWLVWFIDEAKNGNYRGYKVFWLSNPSENELLKANTLRQNKAMSFVLRQHLCLE